MFTLILGIIIAALFLQVLTAVVLATNNNNDYRVLGEVFMVLSFCVAIGLIVYAKFYYIKKLKVDEDMVEYEMNLESDLYYHPMDKEKIVKYVMCKE